MKKEKKEMPPVAVICVIVGVLSIIAGGFAIMYFFANMMARDAGNVLVFGLIALFGSVIWFAMARAIAFLAEIAENTRGKQ